MYLYENEVRQTLKVIAKRSAAGSHVILTYYTRHNGKIPHSLFLSMLGEPIHSAYNRGEMTDLAYSAGWKMVSDSGIKEWQSDLPIVTPLTRRIVGMQWDERIWVGKRILSSVHFGDVL